MDTLLIIPEELFLLTVNEKTGRKAFFKSTKFDLLLSAAILMDLALQHRIDTDLEEVIPDRPQSTGHPLLDTALELIQGSPHRQKINWWLLKLAEHAGRYREMLVAGLVEKGLLRMEKEQVFLGFTNNKYPIRIRDREVTEVRTRIKTLIESNDLPEFRDVIIISIAWYGGLMDLFLDEGQIRKHQSRIEQLARMDLIGQAISKSMQELTRSIMFSMTAKEFFGIKTPEEKLEELVEEFKALMHLAGDDSLPDWLRKGSEQYGRTLDYIRKTGSKEIVFNVRTGQYGLKAGAAQWLTW